MRWYAEKSGAVLAAGLATLATFIGTSAALGETLTYTTITVPGITGPTLTDVDNTGRILGYGGAGQIPAGFILSGQTVNVVSGPGSGGLQAFGFNDSSQVVGTYFSAAGQQAFVNDNGGFTVLRVPGSQSTTAATGVNNSGQIVGNFDSNSQSYGFLYNSGTFTSIFLPGSSATRLLGINDSGEIVGTFSDTAGAQHAFAYSNGAYTVLSLPSNVTGSEATAINNAGTIIGYSGSGNGTTGFLDENGVFTTISYPGSVATRPLGINDAGEIVGMYTDSFGFDRTFLATAESSVPEPESVQFVGFSLMLLLAGLLYRYKVRV